MRINQIGKVPGKKKNKNQANKKKGGKEKENIKKFNIAKENSVSIFLPFIFVNLGFGKHYFFCSQS